MLDCLIVGGGLAGCNLSYQLARMGKSFVMVDMQGPETSSLVAGGIYNPILPKHQKTAYNAHLIYPGITEYYLEAETFLNANFLKQQAIRYILQSNVELNDWSARAADRLFNQWVEVHHTPLEHFISPHGYITIHHSGWVQSALFIAAVKQYLRTQDALREEQFVYSELLFLNNHVQYRDIKARHIIFCEGNGVVNNPFIKPKILNPAKGEILLVKTPFDVDYIPQQGVFMLPQGNSCFRVGSTFTWDPLDNMPTEQGRAEILHKWSFFYKGDYEVLDHVAGVRPASNDRRPVMGRVAPHNNCFVFNGLGAKGVALSPYYGKLLLENIFNQTPLDREIDIARLK